MPNVMIKNFQIEFNLTADQWGLYDIPGRDHAAYALNKHLPPLIEEYIANQCQGPHPSRFFSNLSMYGATDSDAHRVLDRILEALPPTLVIKI